MNNRDEAADVQRALSCCYGDEAGRLLFARFAAAVRAEAIDDFNTYEWAVVARAERTIAVEKAQREAVQQVRHDMSLLSDRVEDYTPKGVRIRLRGYADQLERSLAGSGPTATPPSVV